MKTAKGKVPVGGKTKRVTVAGHDVESRKQKEKDPVEVRRSLLWVWISL